MSCHQRGQASGTAAGWATRRPSPPKIHHRFALVPSAPPGMAEVVAEALGAISIGRVSRRQTPAAHA
jgi:hypothetical protein